VEDATSEVEDARLMRSRSLDVFREPDDVLVDAIGWIGLPADGTLGNAAVAATC
jgi:hypothetical protein